MLSSSMASRLRRVYSVCLLLLVFTITAIVYNKKLSHDKTNELPAVGSNQDQQKIEFARSIHQTRRINSHDGQLPLKESPREAELKEDEDENNINTETGLDFISRIKVPCSDQICSDFIATKVENQHFNFCTMKTWHVKKHPEPKQSTCSFINGTNRAPVALASYPGSGNTWVRGILQEVTGICTGAVYCDVVLRVNGYPGESIRSGATLVVKTHLPDPRWTGVHYDKSAPVMFFHKIQDIPVFSSGIFILRNPFDAFVAEYQRFLRQNERTSENIHVSVAGREAFGENKTWNNFVYEEAPLWKKTILGWIVDNMDHPVLVVKYEDLVQDTFREIKRMLDFLQVPYYTSRLKYVVNRGYSKYKRKHLFEFDHYTPLQRKFLESVMKSTASVVSEHGLLDIANISSYLTS